MCDISLRHLIRADLAVYLLRQIIEFDQIFVAHAPFRDGFFQVAEMSEILIEPNQPVDVFGAIAALQNAFACRLHIRLRLVQSHPQFMTALGHENGLLILRIRRGVAIVRVQAQEIDGVFLAFGPQALACDIAPYGRKHVETHAAQ